MWRHSQKTNVTEALRYFEESDEVDSKSDIDVKDEVDSKSDIDIYVIDEVDSKSEIDVAIDVDDEVEDPSYVADDDELDEDEDEDEEETRDDHRAPESISGSPIVKRKRGQQAAVGDASLMSPKKRLKEISSPGKDAPQNEKPWMGPDDPDTAPPVSRFRPRRTPGVHLDLDSGYSPKELFLLFFAHDTLKVICKNTNKYAAKSEAGRKYKWEDVSPVDLQKFFGLLIYMSLVSLPSVSDYWRQDHALSVPLPTKVMTRDKFRSIMWNVHLSDPEEDALNVQKNGTPAHDKLLWIRPVYESIRNACQAYYHPRKELAVDERMVATKAKTGMTQYMRNKPTKWGLKLFVLADSSNGYTLDFSVYCGKSETSKEHGLAYEAVMKLIQPAHLGTGYHVYMDNFYTSPKLLMDLHGMKYGACGTYRENTIGCPKGRENAISKKSERGAIRWIREGPLIFVKWMDTREVSVCSTVHPAHCGETTSRRIKNTAGQWAKVDIPCPTPILAYNKYMGGVDLSDQLIQYYSTHRRTSRWYKTMLLHFLDIANTNAYILHLEICRVKSVRPLVHKDFMAQLMCELCHVDTTGLSQKRSSEHVPVAVEKRLQCKQCHSAAKRSDTPWKCKSCDVALCLVSNRNCFEQWHK